MKPYSPPTFISCSINASAQTVLYTIMSISFGTHADSISSIEAHFYDSTITFIYHTYSHFRERQVRAVIGEIGWMAIASVTRKQEYNAYWCDLNPSFGNSTGIKMSLKL